MSVVLPTRNRVGLLGRAVRSVLAQTYERFELVVVDDASTDGTRDRIGELAARDSRVRLLRLDRRQGAAAARNRAIGQCDGEYVAFQDDDCIWVRHKLERQLDALERAAAGVGFVYSPLIIVGPDSARRIIGVRAPDDKYLGPWRTGTPAVMVRRDVVLDAGGFDERLPRLQDLDLWVRVLRRTEYTFVPEPLLCTRRLDEGIHMQADRLVQAAALFRRKYGRGGPLPPGEAAELHQMLGHRFMERSLRRAAMAQFLAAVRVQPRRVRAWLAAAAALTGSTGYWTAVRMRERMRGRGAGPTESMASFEARYPDPCEELDVR